MKSEGFQEYQRYQKKQNLNNGKARQGAKYKLLIASFLRQTVMLFAYLKYDHQEISNTKRR